MESIDEACSELKQKYDKCFNIWYSDHFLKGDTVDFCAELFKEYRACVLKAVKAKKLSTALGFDEKDEKE